MTELLPALREHALEIVGVAFGLISVYLATKEKIASWPTAIVNVSIFFFVFWEAKLYADAGLQIVYLVLSMYGWYEWLYGGAQKTALVVSRAPLRHWIVLVTLAVIFSVGLGAFMARHTDSPIPFLDASLTATSLVAQWMMTRKQIENWIVWILANIVYVPTMIARDLPWTAFQYAVFLVLAFMGYRSWRTSLRAQSAGAVAA